MNRPSKTDAYWGGFVLTGKCTFEMTVHNLQSKLVVISEFVAKNPILQMLLALLGKFSFQFGLEFFHNGANCAFWKVGNTDIHKAIH